MRGLAIKSTAYGSIAGLPYYLPFLICNCNCIADCVLSHGEQKQPHIKQSFAGTMGRTNCDVSIQSALTRPGVQRAILGAALSIVRTTRVMETPLANRFYGRLRRRVSVGPPYCQPVARVLKTCCTCDGVSSVPLAYGRPDLRMHEFVCVCIGYINALFSKASNTPMIIHSINMEHTKTNHILQ